MSGQDLSFGDRTYYRHAPLGPDLTSTRLHHARPPESREVVRRAGRRALNGMGNSPGVTNIVGRMLAEPLLDEAEAVDIYHCHGGEAFEGPGVLAHRLHGMAMDIPMFLDGELRTVRFSDDDGIALRTRTDFHTIGRGDRPRRSLGGG